jgi:hypothetical protein
MSTANQIFRVTYVYADGSGIARTGDQTDYVQAASGDEATLKSVLTSNGRSHGTHTISIRSVVNVVGNTNNVLV